MSYGAKYYLRGLYNVIMFGALLANGSLANLFDFFVFPDTLCLMACLVFTLAEILLEAA